MSAAPARRVAVCADDFGQGPAVDAGILRLARMGRVTAVSCFALAPGFAPGMAALAATGVEVGLHLDLTEGFPEREQTPLSRLLLRAHLGLVGPAAARRLEEQLEAFLRAAGGPPAFVDGHQHVHQLPGIRAAVVALLGARLPGRAVPVRCTAARRWRGAKAAVIQALGAGPLRRALAEAGLRWNADFAGVYRFAPGVPYRSRVQAWLATLADGGLLMCHPGEAGGDPGDPIARWRAEELAYLASDAFEEDCRTAGVVRVGMGAACCPPGQGSAA